MARPTTRLSALSLSVVLVLSVLFVGWGVEPAQGSTCDRFVEPSGSDSNPGTSSKPWKTLDKAAAATPDNGCTIWVAPGTYPGMIEIERRFSTKTVFKASTAYRAVLEGDGLVLKVNGARNIEFNGFEIRHDGPGAKSPVIYLDQGDGNWAENITFRNNVIHDSYDDDLMKLYNGAKGLVVEGNVFYNQGPGEEQIDVNGVTDTVIQDNIFFHDYGSSGRSVSDAKHFIVVKDSAGIVPGSRRIKIRRNIFLNWQGGVESFVQIGADGKSYLEARGVEISNNLMVGNGSKKATAALGIAGASDVSFVNNTVAGDLPASAYAVRIERKGSNPSNGAVVFANNIWSDPTGTMDDFSDGDPSPGFELINNLYWNDGRSFESADVVEPKDDPRRVIADPYLGSQQNVQVPVWTGSSFESGNKTIRQEFVRLVEKYGTISINSPARAKADAGYAPGNDILKKSRDSAPDLGAFEQTSASGTFVDDDSSTFEADIEWLAAEGITKGCNPPINDLFCPSDFVTRGQMAAFLHRALGNVLDEGKAIDFVDDDGSTFESDIEWLGATGVTKGCNPPTNDRFCPDDFVTRGQMAAFMVRALGYSEGAGDDLFVDDDRSVFEGDIDRLGSAGVTKGCNPPKNDRFCPDDFVTRGQMAAFIHRALD